MPAMIRRSSLKGRCLFLGESPREANENPLQQRMEENAGFEPSIPSGYAGFHVQGTVLPVWKIFYSAPFLMGYKAVIFSF